MKRKVRETSIDAYHDMPNTKKRAQADRIESVVKFLCECTPGADVSLREIKHTYDKNFGRVFGAIDVSTVSARVNELVAAGRLDRPGHTRKCTISKVTVHPVKPASLQLSFAL